MLGHDLRLKGPLAISGNVERQLTKIALKGLHGKSFAERSQRKLILLELVVLSTIISTSIDSAKVSSHVFCSNRLTAREQIAWQSSLPSPALGLRGAAKPT